MSAFAIVLGVAFVAGLADLHRHPRPGLHRHRRHRRRRRRAARHVGAATASSSSTSTRTVPASLVDDLAGVPGAARADGNVSELRHLRRRQGRQADRRLRAARPGPELQRRPGGQRASSSPRARHRPLAASAPARSCSTRRTAEPGRLPRRRHGHPGHRRARSPRLTATLVGVGEFGRWHRRRQPGASFDTGHGAGALPRRRGRVHRRLGDRRSRARARSELRDRAWRSAARRASRRSPATRPPSEPPAGINQALSFITTFLLVFAGIALVVGRLPHRQHLLDPGRPAQPRAGAAAGARGRAAAR